MYIVVGAKKGGCGKTTVCLALASAAVDQGLNVLCVDTDKSTQSLTEFFIKRESQEVNPNGNIKGIYVNPDEGLDLFAKRVSEYHDWADVVLIDLEGTESHFNRSAISLADVAVVPSRLSSFDIISAASQIVEFTKLGQTGLKVKAVITFFPNLLIQRGDLLLLDGLSKTNMDICDTKIHDRGSYRDCAASGLLIHEMDDEGGKKKNIAKAKIESKGLWTEINGEVS